MKAVKEIVRKYYKYGNTPNITRVGNPTIENGIISGFSTSNWATTVIPVKPNVNNFEIQFKVTTGSTRNSYMSILRGTINNDAYSNFSIQMSGADDTTVLLFHDGSEVWWGYRAMSSFADNTTYWLKWIYDGDTIKSYYSLDGTNFSLHETQNKDTKFINAINKFYQSGTVTLGVTPELDSSSVFTGSIDLKECYIKINNKDVWYGTLAEESTESDYDFYKDVPVYKVIKENDIYKAVKSCTKGQYYGN